MYSHKSFIKIIQRKEKRGKTFKQSKKHRRMYMIERMRSPVTWSAPSWQDRETHTGGECTVWQFSQGHDRVSGPRTRWWWWSLCFCRPVVSPPWCERSAAARLAPYSSRTPRSGSSCRCRSLGARWCTSRRPWGGTGSALCGPMGEGTEGCCELQTH